MSPRPRHANLAPARALARLAGLALVIVAPAARAQSEAPGRPQEQPQTQSQSQAQPPEPAQPQEHAQPQEQAQQQAQPPAPRRADPRTDPVFNSEGVDDLQLEMLQRRPAPAPVAPVTPRVRIVIPPEVGQATNPFLGLDSGGLGASRGELLPEGTGLARRRGSVVKSATGDWVFLAHPDQSGRAERAMVILPSPVLAQIEDELAKTGPRAVCYLSGQVYVYRGENYLLPTAFNLTQAEAAGPESPAATEPPARTEEAPADAQAAPGPPPANSAEAVIRDLEQRRARPRSITRPAPAPPATPGPSEGAQGKPYSFAMGGLISDRRGRVMRLADGRLALAFDRGFSPGPESTMPLLECTFLQRLELQSLGRGDATVFMVSGRAVPYRGTTYFLLSGFQIAPPSDVSSLQ